MLNGGCSQNKVLQELNNPGIDDYERIMEGSDGPEENASSITSSVYDGVGNVGKLDGVN